MESSQYYSELERRVDDYHLRVRDAGMGQKVDKATQALDEAYIDEAYNAFLSIANNPPLSLGPLSNELQVRNNNVWTSTIGCSVFKVR